MNEQMLMEAVAQLPDSYIQEAAGRKKRSSLPLRLGAMAACVCLVFSLVLGVRAYGQVVSTVSVDVNPSLELRLNRWDRVVQVETFNEDARHICDTLRLTHCTYADALDALISCDAFREYLGQDSDLTVTVVSPHAEAIHHTTETCIGFSENGGQFYCADDDALDAAHAEGFSVGKYNAWCQWNLLDPTAKLEDCHDMTMEEIHSHSGHRETEHQEEEHGGCISHEASAELPGETDCGPWDDAPCDDLPAETICETESSHHGEGRNGHH